MVALPKIILDSAGTKSGRKRPDIDPAVVFG